MIRHISSFENLRDMYYSSLVLIVLKCVPSLYYKLIVVERKEINKLIHFARTSSCNIMITCPLASYVLSFDYRYSHIKPEYFIFLTSHLVLRELAVFLEFPAIDGIIIFFLHF
jgi:hypothetical protein